MNQNRFVEYPGESSTWRNYPLRDLTLQVEAFPNNKIVFILYSTHSPVGEIGFTVVGNDRANLVWRLQLLRNWINRKINSRRYAGIDQIHVSQATDEFYVRLDEFRVLAHIHQVLATMIQLFGNDGSAESINIERAIASTQRSQTPQIAITMTLPPYDQLTQIPPNVAANAADYVPQNPQRRQRINP